MSKVRKVESSFLYTTSRLVVFYMSAIQIFQRVFELQNGHELFSNNTKGDNSKSEKGSVVILVCDMSSGPVLHFYQVSSKYSKGYSSYRADKKFYANPTGSVPKTIHPPSLFVG